MTSSRAGGTDKPACPALLGGAWIGPPLNRYPTAGTPASAGVPVGCQSCGFANPPRFKFCGACGMALSGLGGGRRATPLQTAQELGEQLFSLDQCTHEAALVLEAHRALGTSLFYVGEMALARIHLERALALYDPHEHHSLAFRSG